MKNTLLTPGTILSSKPQWTMILIIRSIHGLITLYFLSCIASIYYAGFTGRMNPWVYLAAGSLLLEALVVTLNHGDCPLGPIHHRFGDQKAFFELFLPQPVAKKAVPVLGFIAAVGILLLFI